MPVLPLSIQEKDAFVQNRAITQLMEGRTNATGTATLTSGAVTTTTVTAKTCGAGSVVKLSPQTANAAAALATSFIPSTDVTAKQFIIHHSGSTSTDRTFGFLVMG